MHAFITEFREMVSSSKPEEAAAAKVSTALSQLPPVRQRQSSGVKLPALLLHIYQS